MDSLPVINGLGTILTGIFRCA